MLVSFLKKNEGKSCITLLCPFSWHPRLVLGTREPFNLTVQKFVYPSGWRSKTTRAAKYYTSGQPAKTDLLRPVSEKNFRTHFRFKMVVTFSKMALRYHNLRLGWAVGPTNALMPLHTQLERNISTIFIFYENATAYKAIGGGQIAVWLDVSLWNIQLAAR